MTENRHRTVLEYRVEDRQIRGLEQSVQRAFSEDTLNSFEKGLERIARNIGALSSAADRFGQLADRRGGAPPSGGGGGGGGRAGGGGDILNALTALNANIARMAQDSRRRGVGPSGAGPMAAASYGGAAAGALFSRMGGGGDGIIGQAFSTIPVVGGFLQAGVDAVQRYYAEFAAQQQQIAGSLGALGTRDLAAAGDYTRYGLDRGRAYGAAAGYAQSAGGPLDALGTRAALGLEHLGGIQDPAAIVGAANTGTAGSSGAARVMMQAVSAGLISGLREARLGQYLSTAASALEQARTEGTNLSDDSLNRLMVGFSALGSAWAGERATRAMSSAASTMRAFSPGMDVASAVGLAAVGFGTEGGPGYHDALRMFQNEPDRVLPLLIRQVQAMSGGNEGAGVELMRQIMPRFMGFTPTIDQAEQLMRGDTSGFSFDPGTEMAGDYLSRRRDALMGGFGVAAGEAAYANQRAGIGGEVAGTALQIRGMEASLVSQTLPAIAGGISEILGLLQRSFDVILGQMRTAYGSGSGGPTPADFIEHPLDMLDQLRREIGSVLPPPATPRESLPPEDRGTRPGTSPRASAADALRRISRDAGIAADAIDRSDAVPDGQVMVG